MGEEVKALEYHTHLEEHLLLLLGLCAEYGLIVFAVEEKLVIHEYLTARYLLKLIEAADVGGFTCTRRADDNDHLTLLYRQIHVGEYVQLTEGLR